jgi:hypothetical protein
MQDTGFLSLGVDFVSFATAAYRLIQPGETLKTLQSSVKL